MPLFLDQVYAYIPKIGVGQKSSSALAHLLDATDVFTRTCTRTWCCTTEALTFTCTRAWCYATHGPKKHTFVKRNPFVALRWKRIILKGTQNHQKEAWCVSFPFHENIMSFQNAMKRAAENRSLPKLFIIQESHVVLFPPFPVFVFGESPLIESYCLNILWFVCLFIHS